MKGKKKRKEKEQADKREKFVVFGVLGEFTSMICLPLLYLLVICCLFTITMISTLFWH